METHVYDAVVLATGYERQMHRELLAPVAEYLNDFEVDRDYRVVTDARFKPAVYMQGFCQASHGLSDTLLSVLPVRAEDIAQSVYQFAGKRRESLPRAVRPLQTLGGLLESVG
ncbi:L-ornithine 5-monooxygenase [compost metagenome]